MKKLLLAGSIASLLLPGFAFAAYNDVTLTTDAKIVVDGVTLDVSGSSNVVESITVEGSVFSFNLVSGSTIKVSSSALRQLNSNSAAKFRPSRRCESNESSITHSSSDDAVTITVTVAGSVCPDTSSGSGSGSSGSGGGGGGAAVSAVTPALAVPAANAAAIAAIKTQLISLIQQLIVLLTQELQAMQAGGTY